MSEYIFTVGDVVQDANGRVVRRREMQMPDDMFPELVWEDFSGDWVLDSDIKRPVVRLLANAEFDYSARLQAFSDALALVQGRGETSTDGTGFVFSRVGETDLYAEVGLALDVARFLLGEEPDASTH